MSKHRFTVYVEQDEGGYFIAEVPCVSGCYAQGATEAEAVENCRDVLEMSLTAMVERGEAPPVACRFCTAEEIEVEL